MRALFAVIIFFVSMLLELSLIPKVFGAAFPLSFLVSSVFFAEFRPQEVLGISLANGIVATLFLPSFNGLFLLLFLSVALIVLLMRRFLDGEGIIYELGAIAAGVFAFYLLRPFFGVLLGASGIIYALAPENLSAAFSGREFFLDVIFVALAGLSVYGYERRRRLKGASYV